LPELWTNWAGQQRCAPERIERPGSEAELAAAVAAAGRVRVAGSGHSFTDIACTDGVLLDLRRMNRILGVDGELVTVEPGITLHELGAELAARGLAMENQGDIDRQTLAGAISTATHGTGARFRNLSAQVEGMRVVTGAGEVVELTRDSDDLRAARVGLGALGAISAVKLRCVPLFTVRRVDEPRSLGQTLDRFDELADETTTSSSSPSRTPRWRWYGCPSGGASSPCPRTRSCGSSRRWCWRTGCSGPERAWGAASTG
jgi:FAD/FMN-containing dehydrogenase